MRSKRFAALTAALCIVISLLPLPAGADMEVITISSVNEFKEFTEKCVYDEYSRNRRFVLANDIDLSGHKVQSAEIFCGVFEGGGHSIKNVMLSVEGDNKGLFGAVSKEGEIHDLNVTGTITVTDKKDDGTTTSTLKQRAGALLNRVDIKIDELEDSAKAAGGIVGYNEGKIVNCSYGGTISGKTQVGGIAGSNALTGIIDSCANGAQIKGDKESGGICGYNEGRIKVSKNTGKICPEPDEKTNSAGGICGNNEGAVVGCINEGEIGGESFGDNVGGICGTQSGEVRECTNNGYVEGRRSVGGIVGRFEPYTDIELSYEAARDSIDKQIDIFKDDVDDARKKIIDYVDEMLDGKGWISEILDRLGIKEGKTGERLDRLTDSSTSMMDSITRAVNDAQSDNISGSVKDALNSVTDFSDEARDTLRDTGDSLDTSLANLDDFLKEFDGKGQEITDTLNNLNDSLNKGQDDVDEIKDKLFDQMDDLEADIDDAVDKLDTTHENLQTTMRSLRNAGAEASSLFYDLDNALEDTRKELNRVRDSIETIRKNVQNRINNVKKLIPTLPPVTLPTIIPINLQSEEEGGYSVDEDETLGSGYDVEPSIVGAAVDFLFPSAYAAEEKKTAISDLKSTDIVIPRLIGNEQADTALVRDCINNADVKGTEMAGGVMGCVGFESILKSGENMTLPDGTKVNADSVLKAVTDSCVSTGNITATDMYAGGTAGKCDIGDIKNTLTTGEITVEDGSYAGGIAGYSSGDIVNCVAICDMDGESYLGGIAGHGKNIDTSYSLARLDGKKDKTGAIAGFISGSVNGTYFIDEGLSGINGTNLEGKAEAVKPADIAVDNGQFPAKMPLLNNGDFYIAEGDLFMPQINALAKSSADNTGALLQSKSAELARFHFNVSFIDRGKELKAMTVDYGTVLENGDIPRLTSDGEEVPAWDKDVNAPIVRHTKFTAEYNKATTTLSSGEEPPILLVESVFDEGTEVELSSAEIQHEFKGYEISDAYSFTLTKKAYDTIRVHVRDEDKKATKVAVEENGKWTLLDCAQDGSYAVFEVGAPCKFALLYKEKSIVWLGLVTVGIAALLAAAAFAVLWIVRKKNGK